MKSLLVTALLVAGLQTATTKSKTTRLRAEPRIIAPVVATVPQGTALKIVGAAEDPYLEVEYEGETAYVHKGLINMTPELERALAGGVETAVGLPEEGEIRLSVVSKNTIIRERPTGTSKSLARLDYGETVRIIAKAEGDFWEVQYGDVHLMMHWRTYSTLTLPPGSAGQRIVEARTADNQLLARDEFVCISARDGT